MDLWRRYSARIILAACAPFLLAGSGRADDVPDGRVIPLEVRQGRCDCVLPADRPCNKYYLILSCLADQPGPYRVTVHTVPAAGPVRLAMAPVSDAGLTQQELEWRARLNKVRGSRHADHDFPPLARPSRQRRFWLFTKEGDLNDPANYVQVTGLLRAVGRRCQVYVDRDQADQPGLQATIDDAVRTFDREVWPRARRSLGRALDVDRDGRFTMLFTGWLGRLQNGKVALDGFVRGSDLFRDLETPFSNHADMMYLNTDLKPGPRLRTVLAHEYTHAIIFSEHVLTHYLPDVRRQDEESWLNEGLAHLAEDLHGYGWSNLDYRVSAFLSAPERYALVVPDYYRSGLWRSHGHRGAAYLFLRWCADQYGPDLPARLIQTNLSGRTNLEVVTGIPFPQLFRQWSADLLLRGTHLGNDDVSLGCRPNLRQPLGGRCLCGPRLEEISLQGATRTLRLAATSPAYCLLKKGDGHLYFRVIIEADEKSHLQISLLRLPPHCGRIRLRCEPAASTGAVRLVVTACDADITLEQAAWERLVPLANRPEDTSFRSEQRPGDMVRRWFGDPHLRAGEPRQSVSIALPGPVGGRDIIFKVAGRDAAGHCCAGWAVVANPTKK